VCNWGLASTGEQKITPERIREGLEQFFDQHRFLDVARMRQVPHEAYYQNAATSIGSGITTRPRPSTPAEGEREAFHARLRRTPSRSSAPTGRRRTSCPTAR
jgi:hypothetical protein